MVRRRRVRGVARARDPADQVTGTQQEEVYYFRSDPRSAGAEVLMTVDETSYVGASPLPTPLPLG